MAKKNKFMPTQQAGKLSKAAQMHGVLAKTGVDPTHYGLTVTDVTELGTLLTGAQSTHAAREDSKEAKKATTNGKRSGLGSALEAGRYISRDVYLGVQQGLTSDSSRAKVEVGITDNIQAEVGVGVRADPQVGVKLQWDY